MNLVGINQYIRQPGSQSRQLIQIRDSLNQGVLITHILNIKVSNEPADRNHARLLKSLLKIFIWQVPLGQNIVFNHQQIAAVVTWVMPGVRHSSAYYYTATYLNDLALAQHTRSALSAISNAIRQQHPEFGNQWGLAYLITKPLDFLNQQNIVHGDLEVDANFQANGGEDDEEDDEDDDDDEEYQ
jgi:hypothetical protein